MEHAHLAEQNHGDPATLALGNLCTEFAEQGFDVAPLHIGAGWVGEIASSRRPWLAVNCRLE